MVQHFLAIVKVGHCSHACNTFLNVDIFHSGVGRGELTDEREDTRNGTNDVSGRILRI